MRHQILTVLTIIILGISCQVAAVDATKQPILADYVEGEKWIWKFKGVTSTGEIRANGKDTKEIISKNGELFMLTAHDSIPLAKIVKPVTSKTARYNWPLKVGKKWIFEEHWKSEDGTKGSTIQNAEILSYKQEKVEAGTYMAYTIQFKGKISNSRGYNAFTEDIHVYAPELKTFIKLTQKQDDYLYVEELIEYSQ